MKRKFFDYCRDFTYATFKYPNGFTYPRAWFGFFEGEKSDLQLTLFLVLLEKGFYRTPFQLVFPGQTAGIVKKIEGGREYHVRFYNDGTVECEEEDSRFTSTHYSGERKFNPKVLEAIIKEDLLLLTMEDELKPLLGNKDYSEACIRVNQR